MTGLEIAYLICFFLGLGFAVISALLSGVFAGGDAHVDSSGAPDVHADVGATDGGVHFSPLSPVSISMFLASFGGAGIITAKYFHLPVTAQIPISAGSGFAVSLTVAWLMFSLVKAASSSSTVRVADLVGLDAEVDVSIPKDGMGQISYIRGGRHTAGAKSADNTDIPTGSVVKIVRIVGNTYFVERVP